MADLKTTEFTAETTNIPGLLVFDMNVVADERGYYQEKYQRAKLVATGMPADFNVVQTGISYNKQRGVTRGLHAEPWEKYISMVKGRAFGAWVDLRAGDSFGQVFTTEITPEKAIFLPRGVANAFQVLEDDSYYIYSVSDHWSADKYELYTFVNLADPALEIDWPISLSEAIINDRDRQHPILKDAKPFKEAL